MRRNRVRALCCDVVIESKHQHDFVTCTCGKVSIDGGTGGLWRRVYPKAPPSDWIEEMP